jgi:hypothetical protein
MGKNTNWTSQGMSAMNHTCTMRPIPMKNNFTLFSMMPSSSGFC